MTVNHLKNVWHILRNEGVMPALSYDTFEFYRRFAEKDTRDPFELPFALDHIARSNRPEEYKQAATQLAKDITDDGKSSYAGRYGGLKDVVDATLAGRPIRIESWPRDIIDVTREWSGYEIVVVSEPTLRWS